MSTIYDLSFNDTSGTKVHMNDFRGNVLLLVNTATKCGFAPQFKELEALHQEYKDKGLVVIGFPCNQFKGQEPETNEDMVQVCEINFGVTFMLSEKLNVNGPNTHPLFKYLKDHSTSTFGKDIKWNFTKFLVNSSGDTIRRFAPSTAPRSLQPKVEELLAEQPDGPYFP